MSSYGYDPSTKELNIISGTPKSRLNTIEGNITENLEITTTATAAHPVGQYLAYDTPHKFAVVTQAIAIGDTIANGTNVTDLSVGDVLTSLKSDLATVNSALTPQLIQNPTIIVTNATTDYRTFFYKDSYHAHVHLAINVTTASSNFTVRNLHSILGITRKTILQTHGVAFTNNDSTQAAKSISVDVSNDILWIDMGASIAVGKYVYADIDVYYY